MPDESRPSKTPFDNPWFLPVLLFAMAVWFGYDGWFNEEMEWILFNRVGFGILLALAGYTTVSAVREGRRAREREGRPTDSPPTPG